MADTKFTPGPLTIDSYPATGVMLRDESGERVGYVYDADKANLLADCWYSCPKSDEYCGENKGGECDCGADKHNALLESLFLQSEKGGE